MLNRDVVRLHTAGQRLPFVKAIRGDEAAAILVRTAKGGLVVYRFRTRIYHLGADGRVFCPGRYQIPLQRDEFTAAFRIDPIHGQVRRRRRIVVRYQCDAAIQESEQQLIIIFMARDRAVEGIASAHDCGIMPPAT